MSDPRLTQQQLADRWELSPKTLERWRVEGIGPRFIKLGGTVRYRIEDVDAYERQSLRQSTASAVAVGGGR